MRIGWLVVALSLVLARPPVSGEAVITPADYGDWKLFRYVVMAHRCFSCHKTKEQRDFVFTFDQMKSVK